MTDDARVEKGRIVSLSYVLRDGDGRELDRSGPDAPLQYLHGHGGIVKGLEKALEGRAVGESFQAVVPPEEGYGPKHDLKPQAIRRSELPEGADVSRGASFVMQTKDGGRLPVYVQKVQGPTVYLTPNHPLCETTLHFDVTVAAVREATAEELAHGHAHGPGGHHH